MSLSSEIKKRIFSVIIITIFILSFFVVSVFVFSSYRTEKREANKIMPIPEESAVIIEGWTNGDIDSYFKSSGKWKGDEFLAASGYKNIYGRSDKQVLSHDFVSDFSFLESKPDYLSLEGYLFPDTYRIFSSSSPEEIITKMLGNLDKKLTPKMRQDIEKQGKTIHEIMTMASIIEKEAPIYAQSNGEAAEIIAGIFWNRINIGMGLQSDATLSYIFDDNNPVHSGSELEVDSSYNTYKYRGLPPGPICNPGLIAIKAAIYPANTSYYYFLTTPDSKVYYAKNYDEHLKNKYKYLK